MQYISPHKNIKMEIEFLEPHLEELFSNGKTKNKKYRYQPQVVKKYIQKINILRAASRIEDLFTMNSLNYEVLTNAGGRQSIRVDGTYRIEFYTTITGEEPDKITICSIADLSNHYS